MPPALIAAAERYVKAHQVRIESLTVRADNSDLAPLAAALAGRRIVQLGESTQHACANLGCKIRRPTHALR